jgi:hypothetical protein
VTSGLAAAAPDVPKERIDGLPPSGVRVTDSMQYASVALAHTGHEPLGRVIAAFADGAKNAIESVAIAAIATSEFFELVFTICLPLID